MLKRITVTLVGLLFMFSLAAAPVNGATAEAQEMTVFSQPNFTGDSDTVTIPGTACTAIPTDFSVQSVDNPNSSPDVLFYDASGCADADFVGRVSGPGTNPALDAPATHFRLTS